MLGAEERSILMIDDEANPNVGKLCILNCRKRFLQCLHCGKLMFIQAPDETAFLVFM